MTSHFTLFLHGEEMPIELEFIGCHANVYVRCTGSDLLVQVDTSPCTKCVGVEGARLRRRGCI